MADKYSTPKDYDSMDNPYDKNFNRTGGGSIAPIEFNREYMGEQGLQTPTGAVEHRPVDTGESLDNVWIRTFIRSKDWKPRAQGFNIDGRTGVAEFSGVLIRGQIEASGGLTAAAKIVYNTYDAGLNDFTILVDSTVSATSVNLPAAGTVSGKIYVVKKIDSTVNDVSVTSLSPIDGSTTYTLGSQWDRVMVQAVGDSWYVLN